MVPLIVPREEPQLGGNTVKEDISAPHLLVPQSLQAGYKPASNCYHLTPIWILANKHRKCCCRQFQPERILLVASDELEHRETAKLCALYESRTGSRTEPEGKLLKKLHIAYTSPVLQSCELK